MSGEKSSNRYREVRDVVDADTGEVVRSERTYSIRLTEEPFYMTFTATVPLLCKIERILDVRVMAKLCELAEWNTGHVKFGADERRKVALALKTSTANVSNSLTRLKRLGILAGRGSSLEINPRIYWKGTTKVRRYILDSAKESGKNDWSESITSPDSNSDEPLDNAT